MFNVEISDVVVVCLDSRNFVIQICTNTAEHSSGKRPKTGKMEGKMGKIRLKKTSLPNHGEARFF
ncbi:MAG: hypothetical protein H7Y04_00610 [Verrucomicrobia bacterium]|nr:hypothetical protein [Cytophagales bacterium]